MFEAEVISTQSLTPRVRGLSLQARADFEFLAGQWVSIRFPFDDQPGRPLKRSYSIASAPGPGHRFDLAVTRVDNGPGSTYLHEVVAGTVLSMSRAQGMFELPDLARPVLMVATGTGVAPFRAMLQALVERTRAELSEPTASPRVTLLLGARTEEDLLYRSEWERLPGELAGFRFEPTLSRPDPMWSGRRGRVQTHLAELVAAHHEECDLLICGVGEMVKDVRRLAREELGLARDQVRTERFD